MSRDCNDPSGVFKSSPFETIGPDEIQQPGALVSQLTFRWPYYNI